jgi:hypothetical protein
MQLETRHAALCIFSRNATFLVAEIVDPHGGAVLHRPQAAESKRVKRPSKLSGGRSPKNWASH